jgi:dephospho-CoA kinase
VYLIGLTGGIASGKSVVAQRLAELGSFHIDADLLAREVVAHGTAGLAAIEKAFGPTVIAEDGTLNRPALGALVFGDPASLAILNGITHPAIHQRVKELFVEAQEANPDVVVVYDVPLLAEGGARREFVFDLIVVVDAAIETRIARMVELRGLTRQEALHRINSQATDAARLAIADVVIDNNGTVEETLSQVEVLWQRVAAGAGGDSAETGSTR